MDGGYDVHDCIRIDISLFPQTLSYLVRVKNKRTLLNSIIIKRRVITSRVITRGMNDMFKIRMLV